MSKIGLKNGINRGLDEGSTTRFKRASIRAYGENDWKVIKESLLEWEEKGYLKILTDPEQAEDSDDCIEMLGFIERSGKPHHWPNP